MYKIGELSKLSNITVKALRYYDSEGILPPDRIDDFTGYRYYSAAKLSDCYRILALKELGFSLSEIKALFALPQGQYAELIAAKERELEQLLTETENRINMLRKLNSAFKEEKPMFDIVIRKSDALCLAYDRKTVASKQDYEEILRGMQAAVPKEIRGSRKVIIDYETEFVTGDVDTGFGIEITGKLPTGSGLTQRTLCFAGDTANLVCSDAEYEDAARHLNKYVLDNNYQITGPVYKIIYEDGTVELKLPVVKLGCYHESLNEELDVPFVNDEAVIGRWEAVSFLPSKEMFSPKKTKSVPSNGRVNELYFLPGGERYWCFGWTKGLLLSNCGYPHRKTQNRYTIEKIGDAVFLFIEFKGYHYFEGGKPEIWVFRKADAKAYTKQEIMTVDEIPDVPADDVGILGKWEVCDLVRSVDSFDPQHICAFIPYEALYWRSAEFLGGGQMINVFKSYEEADARADPPEIWRWINGYVICNPRSTASRYILRRHGNTEYLFIQWKSGDYSFGGDEPFWYVFQK